MINKLIIHIGTEKTGSTSIQKSLLKNRDALEAKKISYMDLFGVGTSRDLASYSLSQYQYDDYLIENGIYNEYQKNKYDKLVEEEFEAKYSTVNCDIETLIISSEHFHSRLIDISSINKLKNLFEGRFKKIEILVYLRDQTELAISWYSTVSKYGNIKKKGKVPTFESFVDDWCHKENHYFNYLKMLDLWSDVFGKNSIKIKIFNRSEFQNSDLIYDFYNYLGVDSYENVGVKNKSLSDIGLKCARSINAIFPRDSIYAPIRKRLMSIVINRLYGKPKLMTKEIYDKIYFEFDSINKMLMSKYGIKSKKINQYRPPEK